MPACLEATDLGFCQRRPMKRLGVRPQTLITVNLMQRQEPSPTERDEMKREAAITGKADRNRFP